MCGITGFWNTAKASDSQSLETIVRQMSDTLVRRGPDDGGQWVDEASGIALGHRRLAILDLSSEGHQPMMSRDGRYVIVFNGEIYNFLELRQQLERLGHQFRGHSDTEVILASLSQWGLEPSVAKFNGMFAFAVWDRQERILHLGRDRFGEKPLYYGWLGQTFFFGSELKSLKAHPDFQTNIDRDALTLFLRYKYIPAPYSIYQNIYKLPPGTIATVDNYNSSVRPKPFWSAREVAERAAAKPFLGTEAEAIEQLNVLLRDSVASRMVSDVPLGAFLSGGIDSSTIVALMQAQSSQPVKTFTIGFNEDEYNEARYAKKVADHLGTEHTEMYVTPQQALEVIPELPGIYDEPFADCSQIPTFLLSKLTRQYVTVSLSGDGGDEFFAGYTRYLEGYNLWQKIGWIPKSLRYLAGAGLNKIPSSTWNGTIDPISPLLPTRLKYPSPGEQIGKIAEILMTSSPEAFYLRLISDCKNPESLTVIGSEKPTITTNARWWAELPHCIDRFAYLDTVTYLPDDILVKVDRASMAVGLESRVPLLDPNVFEFAWRLPRSMKIKQNRGKHILRQVLARYVPQELFDRPKTGFGVPIDRWLRGPLRDWAEDLLDRNRLCQEGFFQAQPIRQQWTEHLSQQRDWHYSLWNILMFQAWLAEETTTQSIK
jgi:asparagine synthase (glutamine-hydrolysing)